MTDRTKLVLAYLLVVITTAVGLWHVQGDANRAERRAVSAEERAEEVAEELERLCALLEVTCN